MVDKRNIKIKGMINIMNTVQYGEWKISVDIEKTKQYYREYKKTDNQANRNFAEYCKNLSAEEQAFFDTLGINPVCCNIEHNGADKKRNFPCGGYYYVCGEYLEYPPEEILNVEELIENNYVDSRPDPRIDIGVFQFDFQCEAHHFNDIPEDMPQGFICINFWCEDMKWLLTEKPETMMYEPPHFWQIHKIIKEKIDIIKQERADFEEIKSEFTETFKSLNIVSELLDKKEIKKLKKDWIAAFSPKDGDSKAIKKLCKTYLWHIFSFEFLECEIEEKANALFEQQDKSDCIIISNVDNIAFHLKNAANLNVEITEQFTDVTVTASDFSWTYSNTHEGMCGPYFYKK